MVEGDGESLFTAKGGSGTGQATAKGGSGTGQATAKGGSGTGQAKVETWAESGVEGIHGATEAEEVTGGCVGPREVDIGGGVEGRALLIVWPNNPDACATRLELTVACATCMCALPASPCDLSCLLSCMSTTVTCI